MVFNKFYEICAETSLCVFFFCHSITFQKYISKLTTLLFYHKKIEKAIERHKYLQFVPFYHLNETFFNAFSHLSLILLKDMSINVRDNSRITMPKVLGNNLNVKSVIYHQTGITVSQRMNAKRWQVIIDKDFLQLLVIKAPTVVITDS